MVYVFLADGFEIIEALAPVDMLRRAKIDTVTVGVTGRTVKSSCGVEVTADITIDEFEYRDVQAIVFPGGYQGTLNLEKCAAVQSAIDKAADDGKYICAICASPSILGHKGLLRGKTAIAFPGFEDSLEGAVISDKHVVTDGKYITAKGAGVSVEFGLEIVKALAGEKLSNQIRGTIQCL